MLTLQLSEWVYMGPMPAAACQAALQPHLRAALSLPDCTLQTLVATHRHVDGPLVPHAGHLVPVCLLVAERQLQVGSRRWLLLSQEGNQEAARTACQSRGGELLTLNTPDDSEVLYQAFAGLRNFIWFGLVARPEQAPTINKLDWMWASTGLTPDYESWDNWDPSEPNNWNNQQGRCGSFWASRAGLWDDAECSRTGSVGTACQLGECSVTPP